MVAGLQEDGSSKKHQGPDPSLSRGLNRRRGDRGRSGEFGCHRRWAPGVPSLACSGDTSPAARSHAEARCVATGALRGAHPGGGDVGGKAFGELVGCGPMKPPVVSNLLFSSSLIFFSFLI
jgi:hypothetical protein